MRDAQRRGRLLCVAATLALLFLAAMGPSADAALRLRLVGKSVTRLYSDGARWAAYEPSVGTTRVIDADTGRAVDRPNPSGCNYSPHEGGLVAVGGGELLYSCEVSGCPFVYSGCSGPNREYWQARYVVEDAATGREHEITRLPYNSEVPILHTIGSQWAMGEAVAYKYKYTFYLNWHTGQVASPELSPTEGIDLDSASLNRSLCSPVLHGESPQAIQPPVEPEPAYAPPFALEETGYELNQPRLVLLRCGSVRQQPLPGDDEDTSLQIGGGIISWIAQGKNRSGAMYATRLNYHGRRWHGPTFHLLGPKYPSHVKIAQAWTLQHTSTTVYQSVPAEEEDKGPMLIYGIRLP
jgi:hypothetical protein